YLPLRTFFTGNTEGKKPVRYLHPAINMTTSISYFLGKVLPDKLFAKKQTFKIKTIPKLIKEKTSNANIILILGESLTRNKMSLYGYTEITTPNLDKIKNNLIIKKGISAAVFTDTTF